MDFQINVQWGTFLENNECTLKIYSNQKNYENKNSAPRLILLEDKAI